MSGSTATVRARGGTAPRTNERTQRRARLDSLTGLRALAAFVVFVHHVARPRGLGGVWHDLTNQGAVGVTFFFALSGFVLTWSRQTGDSAVGFYRRRFARIYPALFVALVAGLLFDWHGGHPDDIAHALPAFMGFQSWIPRPDYYFAVNGVTWSLSCEAFFYVTFPLYADRLFSIGTRERRLLQVALVAIIVGFDVVAHGRGGTLAAFSQHLPLIRVCDFILGALVAVDVMKGRWPRMPVGVAGGFAAMGYLAAGFIPAIISNVAIVIVPFLFLLGAVAYADHDGVGTVFNRRWIVWLGEISFSFYLVHALVILFLGRRIASWPVTFVVSLAGSLVAATLLHYIVERPMERWIRGSNSVVVSGVQHARLAPSVAPHELGVS